MTQWSQMLMSQQQMEKCMLKVTMTQKAKMAKYLKRTQMSEDPQGPEDQKLGMQITKAQQ